jgi:hypothetical protein
MLPILKFYFIIEFQENLIGIIFFVENENAKLGSFLAAGIYIANNV